MDLILGIISAMTETKWMAMDVILTALWKWVTFAQAVIKQQRTLVKKYAEMAKTLEASLAMMETLPTETDVAPLAKLKATIPVQKGTPSLQVSALKLVMEKEIFPTSVMTEIQ